VDALVGQKSRQVAGILRELRIDCWLVWVRETPVNPDPVLPLVLGTDLTWQSALIFTADGQRIAIVGKQDADGLPSGLFDRVIGYREDVALPLAAELARLDPARIAVNYSLKDVAADGMSVGMYRLLRRYLRGTPYSRRLQSAEEVITRLRGRKLPDEASRIAAVTSLAQQILADLCAELRVGQSEQKIAARLREMTHKRGGITHAVAVDAGPNKRFGHGLPTNNLTKNGHLLHVDFAIERDGYCTDLQRMFFFGSPEEIPSEVQRAFAVSRGAIAAAAACLRPGVRGYRVDAAARRHLQESGYEEYMYALGHGVGRGVHDGGLILGPRWPRYGAIVTGRVEAGNIFALEPRVETEHYGQLSLEEIVAVTAEGSRYVSSPQQELFCVAN
jgi:Xaa-Pro aminopeptidase